MLHLLNYRCNISSRHPSWQHHGFSSACISANMLSFPPFLAALPLPFARPLTAFTPLLRSTLTSLIALAGSTLLKCQLC